MNDFSAEIRRYGFPSISTPDEERLLTLYRDLNREQRSELLYRITRLRYAPYFMEEFKNLNVHLASDPSYLYEELEEQLRMMCPREMLGEYLCDYPHFLSLLISAWGSVALVILGSSEQDGQRADELYNEALQHWALIGDKRIVMKFSRKDALTFIETWRGEVLKQALQTN